MGLSICFELSLPAGTSEANVRERLSALREVAAALPFTLVTEVVRLTERELTGPWPMQGLAFVHLEDVVDVTGRFVREELHGRHLGRAEDDMRRVDVPDATQTVVLGFAIAPGPGCEPASFALAANIYEGRLSEWRWHCCCKTQYASNLGEENFLRCHQSLVAVLEAARELGFECEVSDEGGYWESRDTKLLLERVGEMNRLVARFAGAFTDAYREASGDSSGVQGAIFEHPDFERLESDE
jgi:hypothetical protein